MYRTALDHFRVFDALHAVGPTKLVGDHSVWFWDQFDAWNVTVVFDGEIHGGGDGLRQLQGYPILKREFIGILGI